MKYENEYREKLPTKLIELENDADYASSMTI